MVISNRPMRLVNQLESGTSPSVLTLSAGPFDVAVSPKLLNHELVALGESGCTAGVVDVAHVVVLPPRIVGVEPRAAPAQSGSDWATGGAGERAGEEQGTERGREDSRRRDRTSQGKENFAAECRIEPADQRAVAVEAEPHAVGGLHRVEGQLAPLVGDRTGLGEDGDVERPPGFPLVLGPDGAGVAIAESELPEAAQVRAPPSVGCR